MEYFRYEPFNVQEIQMALSLAMKVRNKDNDVTYEDFMISKTRLEEPDSSKLEGAALDVAIRSMFS